VSGRERKLNPLGAVLEQALKSLDLTEAALEARAVMIWGEVVGPQLAKATEAQKVQGGTLIVITRSSSWNQELSLQKPTLLRRYRERLGKDLIKDVRFTVGAVRGVPATRARTAPPEDEVRRIRLPEPEIEKIRAAAESADPELSQAIRRALTREAQLRVWQLSHGAKECPGCGAAYRTTLDRCPGCRVAASSTERH
jgi:predicted nucleic acid-binding Zn ribbon protein